MLTLYFKPTCPFCQNVLGEAENLNIKMNLKDINDEGIADELIARGGKRQVPYLVDEEKGVEMYESGDIINYLNEHYSGGTDGGSFNGVKLHDSGETCESCQ